MGSRTLDYNQSGRVVHADQKFIDAAQGLGATDYRMVIVSSVAKRDHRASSSEYCRGIAEASSKCLLINNHPARLELLP
jgi:hypothetical protein